MIKAKSQMTVGHHDLPGVTDQKMTLSRSWASVSLGCIISQVVRSEFFSDSHPNPEVCCKLARIGCSPFMTFMYSSKCICCLSRDLLEMAYKVKAEQYHKNNIVIITSLENSIRTA